MFLTLWRCALSRPKPARTMIRSLISAKPDLPGIFLQVLLVARELGVLTVGQISLDGTKIKANASKHHALSYGHAGPIKAKLRREIARLLQLAQAEVRLLGPTWPRRF